MTEPKLVGEGGESPPSYKHIAVVGTAPSSRSSAPFPEPGCPFLNHRDWHVRCVGMDPMKVTPGWNRWYELHSPEWLTDKFNNPDYQSGHDVHIAWLKRVSDQGADVLLTRPSPMIPKAGIMRRAEILKEWDSPYSQEFLNSTIAWMMADAILDKPETIGLWGVDMALTEEYARQRSGVFFFLEEAKRRGIKTLLPPQSDLFFGTGMYPDNTETPYAAKIFARRRELVGMLGQAQQMKMQAVMAEATKAGALESLDWCAKTFFMK